MDVNLDIDELVLHGEADIEEFADRIRTATEGAVPPAAAALIGRAVVDSIVPFS